MSNYHLSPDESIDFADFLKRPDVKKLIEGGGQWGLVFGPHTGIGVGVIATACSKDRTEIIHQDITDYKVW